MSHPSTPPHAALERLARSRNRLSLALVRLQSAEHSSAGGSAAGSVLNALGSLALGALVVLLKRWGWIAVPTLTELISRWLASQEPPKPSHPPED
jgi:hypothetical protein